MADQELEEGSSLRLDFKKLRKIASGAADVIPAVAQDAVTGEVLILGYANELAVRETFARRSAVLWSTSRNELWHKGATSGDTLDLVDVRVNCEQNSLLYRVRPRTGGVCHTQDQASGEARNTCYYRLVEDPSTLQWA